MAPGRRRVHAELDTDTDTDTDTDPTGIKIPDKQIKALHDTGVLHRQDRHPKWNHTLNPPEK